MGIDELSNKIVGEDGSVYTGYSHFKEHDGGIITFAWENDMIEREMPPHLRSQFPFTMALGGWGNGYVAIPLEHPFLLRVPHSEHYADVFDCTIDDTFDTMNEVCPLPHNSWTFSRLMSISDYTGNNAYGYTTYRIFGFDTMHAWQNKKNWPEARVVEEIENIVPFINENI